MWVKKNVCINLIIIIQMVILSASENSLVTNKMQPTTNKVMKDEQCKWIQLEDCTILCSQIDAEKVGRILENKLIEEPLCQSNGINLKLRSVKIPNFTLQNNTWRIEDIQLKTFNLDDTDVYGIENNAFNVTAFKSLNALTLSNLNIGNLNVHTFNGFKALEKLNITQSKLSKNIPANVFQNIKYTLKTLNLHFKMNEKPLQLENITGQPLPNVEVVDLRYNNLKNTLNEKSFIGLSSVQQLYLSNCNVETIGRRTFDFIAETIELIDLSENRLTQIDTTLFDLILPQSHFHNLLLNDNDWNCNCEINNLKIMLRNFAQKFPNNIYCFDTSLLSNRLINVSDVCETTSTEYEIDKLWERSLASPTISQHCTSQTNPSDTETIQISNRDFAMNLTGRAKGDVEINFETEPSNFLLLWFSGSPSTPTADEHSADENDVNCVHNMAKTITLQNFTEDKTYTFCLMGINQQTVSPLNCVPYYVPKSGPVEVLWLAKDSKPLTIGLVVLGILFSSVLGLIIGVCVVRRNPTWLRGSKRVVIVNSRSNSKSSDVMVMPPEWSKDENLTDSNNNNNTIPYRRYSDVSITSGKSYVTAVNPSQFDIIKYQLEKQKKLESQNNLYIENLPDLNPPPLPPPNRRSRGSTVSTMPLGSVSRSVDENYYASYCYK